MFEKLIERRIKSIGQYETLTPTSGETWCPIIAGSFNLTYDGSTHSACTIKPADGSCLCMWYWDTPVNLMAIQLFTTNYHMKGVHELYMIEGRANGSWITLSTVRTNLNHNAWHTLNVALDNCTGIMIALQHHNSVYAPLIREVRILYEAAPPPEGEARITEVKAPSEFTPGVPFYVLVRMVNDGGEDTLFFRFINQDTGATIRDLENIVRAGGEWAINTKVTLTQTTIFHGRIDVGHEESVSTHNFLISPGGC